MSNNIYNHLKKIDTTIAKPPSELSLHIISKFINESLVLENYLFQNLRSPQWFNILKLNNYFDKKNNPIPSKAAEGYHVKEWKILPYLELVSKACREYDQELLNIISKTTYHKVNGKYVDNYRTWWYFTKILVNIPLSDIPKEFIEKAIPIWIESQFPTTLQGSDLVTKLLPKFLAESKTKENFEKTEALINILLSVKYEPEEGVFGNREETKTLIEQHWLEKGFLDQYLAKKIGEVCSVKLILFVMDSLQEMIRRKTSKREIKDAAMLYESHAEDYSYIWVKDITKMNHSHTYNADDLFVQILREMALSKTKTNTDEGKDLIIRLLSDDYPQFIFKRIAIFLIAEEWEKYKDIFRALLTQEKTAQKYFFIYHQLEKELQYLLSKNALNLSTEVKESLNNILESESIPTPNYVPKEKRKDFTAEKKQEWYMVLKEDQEYEQKYEEYKKITKRESRRVEEEEGGWIDFEKSPVSKVDLITWNNERVATYIHTYEVKDLRSPTIEGIHSTLRGAIVDNPYKFSQNLAPFLILDETNFYTLSYIFQGFKDAWTSQNPIDWNNILTAIGKLVENEAFWKNGKENSKEKFSQGFTWCLSSIADLLQEGCKTDAWAFDESLHAEVENIISNILTNFDDTEPFETSDQLNHALNSVLGKTISALIFLGLREARLSDKKNEKKESKWSQKLKEGFKYALEEKKLPDAYALLGQYLANIHYIDKNWTATQIKRIEATDENLFISFLDGYLYIGQVYDHLYKLMIPAYKRGLDIQFDSTGNGMSKDRLIDHIAIGYLRGFEKMGNRLVNEKYVFNNPTRLETMISFFWQQRDFINKINGDETEKEKQIKEDFRDRIFAFWNFISEQYKDIQQRNLNEQKVLSELSKLTIYCSEISKREFELLKVSAPYVTVGFDSTFFIESLNELKDKGNNKIENAEHIANLFILMLEGAQKNKSDFPDFDSNHIIEIVGYLYKNSNRSRKLKDLTDRICVLYAEGENLMLRSMYEKYN